jgi:dTDP-4-amino-4,6-dideoxygalactose transaminase
MWIVADTAPGIGGVYKGRTTGSLGDIATTSFFPALGCYGDGGAVVYLARGVASAGGFVSYAWQRRKQI